MSERCKHGKHVENPCSECDEDRGEQESSFAPAQSSARSGLEITYSLRLHGWKEDIMALVFTSGNLVKVVWPDGRTVEAQVDSPNQKLSHDA